MFIFYTLLININHQKYNCFHRLALTVFKPKLQKFVNYNNCLSKWPWSPFSSSSSPSPWPPHPTQSTPSCPPCPNPSNKWTEWSPKSSPHHLPSRTLTMPPLLTPRPWWPSIGNSEKLGFRGWWSFWSGNWRLMRKGRFKPERTRKVFTSILRPIRSLPLWNDRVCYNLLGLFFGRENIMRLAVFFEIYKGV